MIKYKILVIYYSLGGNTEVLSNRIVDRLNYLGEEVDLLSLDRSFNYKELDIEKYELVMMGTPSYGKGNTPKSVLDFLRYVIKENDFNLPIFSVYGTGDTQWGEKLFCRAVDEIEYHLSKKINVITKLKIEQRPMSNYQIRQINDYVDETIRGL